MRKLLQRYDRFRLPVGLVAMIALFTIGPTPDARGAVYKSRIDAKWSPDNSHFWYRNDLAEGHREMLVTRLS